MTKAVLKKTESGLHYQLWLDGHVMGAHNITPQRIAKALHGSAPWLSNISISNFYISVGDAEDDGVELLEKAIKNASKEALDFHKTISDFVKKSNELFKEGLKNKIPKEYIGRVLPYPSYPVQYSGLLIGSEDDDFIELIYENS